MARLHNKVAIITGAAMGMGEADALLFAKEGAKIVATDVDLKKVEAVAKAILASGGEAIALQHDVSNQDDWQRILAATIEAYGTVDVLINNAGILSWKNMEQCTLESWNRVQAVNSTGVFLGMKAIIPEMQKKRKGSIVNVSSIAGMTGSTFASGGDIAYCASKWAVRGMSKFAANAYAADSIRVNSLHPGPTNTPLHQGADRPKKNEVKSAQAEAITRNIPLPPHLSQPISQAYAALFLASDEADFITGIEMPCDGGFSSQ